MKENIVNQHILNEIKKFNPDSIPVPKDLKALLKN